EATAEEFISGSPLPLTDGTIGPDGAMYFATGGRRLESDLYRVYYKGEPEAAEPMEVADLPEAAKIRRDLEKYHSKNASSEGLDLAWANLAHADRFVQYAARLVLEHQPIELWKSKALNESDPVKKTQAVLALARQGKDTDAVPMLRSLMEIDYASLS
ncbi:MAG TPA: heme-binding protein, partial [Algoriphagus sp.]|nr:heme-binding protein [Algoriphagus sp.]